MMQNKSNIREDGYEEWQPEADPWVKDYTLEELVERAYMWQGSHHRQWWVEQVAARLDMKLPLLDEKGIAP